MSAYMVIIDMRGSDLGCQLHHVTTASIGAKTSVETAFKQRSNSVQTAFICHLHRLNGRVILQQALLLNQALYFGLALRDRSRDGRFLVIPSPPV